MDLKQRLEQEGYGASGGGPLVYESGPQLLAIYDFRVERVNSLWRVCDTERGEVLRTHLTTSQESEACEYWYEQVSGMMLLLSSSKNKEYIDHLENELKAADLKVWRNDIPQFNALTIPAFASS